MDDIDDLDYDIRGCLQYNPQSFAEDDIARVLAVIEGENDGADWHWVLALKNGTYAYLVGGCDYTEWDCQSSAWSKIFGDAALACTGIGDYVLTEDASWKYSPDDCATVIRKFTEQISNGKQRTRRDDVAERISKGEE